MNINQFIWSSIETFEILGNTYAFYKLLMLVMIPFISDHLFLSDRFPYDSYTERFRGYLSKFMFKYQ